MLSLLNSCRVMRRVMHKREPSAHADGEVGSEAYTTAGMRVWRTMIRRMGWRTWHDRVRGKEKRQRVSIPKSHGQLLKRICGVEDEEELLDILSSEPDLLFKALFDNLNSDYVAFRSLENNTPSLFWREPVESLANDDGGRGEVDSVQRSRTPAEVAERLDQLLWFGRGQFTHDADITNRRIVIVADRFESAYREQFKRAFIEGDCARMCEYARVLENIREGRGCIRILVDAHPLFSCYGSLDTQYAHVLATSDKVIDSHTFDSFLTDLQQMIEEHSRVVALALPPPTLPVSALYCFIQALFGANGVALSTLRKLYAHLRSVAVASAPSSPQSDQQQLGRLSGGGPFGGLTPAARIAVVPDEATKDILYLTTVADVVALLLVAANKWSAMSPVAVPSELGRRCVFSAFDDVIGDYVQLERRIIERAYEAELDQWMAKAKSDPFHASAAGNRLDPHSSSAAGGTVGDGLLTDRHRRDSVASVRGPGLGVLESIRLVNFRQREQQMQEYKLRVLRVLEGKLNISLPPEVLGVDTNAAANLEASVDEDSAVAADAAADADLQKDVNTPSELDAIAEDEAEDADNSSQGEGGESKAGADAQVDRSPPSTEQQQPTILAAGSDSQKVQSDSSNRESGHDTLALLSRPRSIGSQREALKRTVVGDMMWSSPISIDVCLNMVLANRDAIDRLSVFAGAPPDMRLRRLAMPSNRYFAFCYRASETIYARHLPGKSLHYRAHPPLPLAALLFLLGCTMRGLLSPRQLLIPVSFSLCHEIEMKRCRVRQ
ncbi:hypothetical protein GQ54DRAFT_126384 [Martensiomyces pterosporus]|nr:hypothetical protein GQ54DRAFT_126384 [Martensiomyces pterosporus]